MSHVYLTSLIHRENDLFVAFCPELDIASQGETPEQAKQSLTEALELFYETASDTEIERRLRSGQRVEQIEVNINREVGFGQTAGAVGA